MHFSHLTRSKKTAHDATTDDTHDYLVSVAQELGINVSDEKKEYDESKEATKMEWMSYREQDPFNEFLGGASGRKDEGLVKAFPDVFFLGKGYDSNRASLNEEQVDHLLKQFTTNAASCQPLLFYLFDQMQRHGSIKGMHAKEAQNPSEFAKFAEEFKSESFQEKLKEAIKDPHGKVAKQVMKKIEPILTGGGKRTTYGALARADTGGKIMAMRRRYGCAPAFLTFGMDDVNNPTAIRMTMSSSSNTDFPAVVSRGHHEAMKHGFKHCCGEDEISIPASYSARLRALVNNPVGAASVYQQLVINVLSILVGKRPGFGQKSGTTRTTEFATWDEKNIGINGMPLAFLGVNETTGGGSLHFHVVLWGGLSPDILEMVADMTELCKHVGSVLDSTYSATLPRDVHVRDLVTKDLKQNCDSSQAFKRRDAAASAMQVPPDPVEARDEFKDFTYCTVCGRNIHEHSHTCFKPPTGYHGCRMCRPAGDSDETRPIQLFWNEEDGKPVENESVEAAGPIPDDSKDDLFPLASSDDRVLLWELRRPNIEGLPALDYGLDEKKAKDHLVSKLSVAMWGETNSKSRCGYIVECDALEKERYRLEEIDTHSFFDDNDQLFHGMLKGLVTAGVSYAYKTSVKDLRKELVDWWKAHPNEMFKGKTLEDHILTQSGGELDLHLLSKAKGVNVHLYTEDASSGSFSLEEVLKAGGDAENAAAIYFVKKSGREDCYKLFAPKRNAIMRELQSLSLKELIGLYDRVAKKLEDRNGWVVEYNPLLTSLLGCNSNLAFLGSKEQSKQALFYIGPYINKNGVKVVDALPLLAHAQNHALQYPSVADDSDTTKRQVQYIVTRVLNKLNSLMEISDTQAALALLGMGPTVCSDIFSYYDLRTTKNFVLDQYFDKCRSLDDMGIPLDGVDDAESLGDADSYSSVPSDGDEEETHNSCDEMSVEGDSCNEEGSQNGCIIENR